MKQEKAIKILKKHSKKLVKDTRHAHFAIVEKRGDKFVLNLLVTKKHSSHDKVKTKKLKEKDADTEALDVEITISKPITAFAARTDKWRPAPGGVSIGHYNISAGTLGCTVYKNETKYILSNNHILADCNDGEIEDAIYQPGPYDGGTIADKIGELFEYVELVFNDAENPNTVDCALCLPDLAADVNAEIIDLEYPTAIEDPTIGNDVVKSGRTTGIREGVIKGIANGWVGYGAPGDAWFEDQIVITNISAGGDSGSLIVDKDNGTAVGLLFAGSDYVTIANKMTVVASELSITLLSQTLVDDEANVSLSCSVAVEQVEATPIANQADVELSNSVAVEVYTGHPITNQATVELSCSVSFEVVEAIRVTLSATVYLSALVSNYGYAHYGPNDLSGLYRMADDSLEGYELYRGQDVEPDFDAAPWETFATFPHTSDVVMDMDLRPNCVAQYKMNDKRPNPWVVGLNGVPTERVENGTLDDDSIWTWGLGWSWEAVLGGLAKWSSGNGYGIWSQDIGSASDEGWAVFFQVLSGPGDIDLQVKIGGALLGTVTEKNKRYVFTGTAGDVNSLLEFVPIDGSVKIDNVSAICLDDFPLTGIFNDFTNTHSVAGKIGTALEYNADNYTEVGHNDVFNFGTGDWSIEIWFNSDIDTNGLYYDLIDKRIANDGFVFTYKGVGGGNGRIWFKIRGTSNTGAIDIPKQSWCQLLAVRLSGVTRIYVNNVEDVNIVEAGTVTNSEPVLIGHHANRWFDGKIDVTRLFNKALSEAERNWLWNGSDGRAGLVKAQTYHFATRLRNIYNLVSQNIESWDLEVNEDGDVLYNPAAPQNISITPAPEAKGLVKAQYIYDPDLSNTATTWLIYFTDDGTDPDPDSDVPTEVTMYKSNGIAHLSWLSPAADDDDTLKVLVRTRVTISSIDYDSQNTDIYSCTANSDGPAAPTGKAFFGEETEAM